MQNIGPGQIVSFDVPDFKAAFAAPPACVPDDGLFSLRTIRRLHCRLLFSGVDTKRHKQRNAGELPEEKLRMKLIVLRHVKDVQ